MGEVRRVEGSLFFLFRVQSRGRKSKVHSTPEPRVKTANRKVDNLSS